MCNLKSEIRNPKFILIILSLCLSCTALKKQPGASSAILADPNRMLAEYFRAETAKLQERCLADIKTLQDWESKRPLYREQLFEMLGLDPMPEKTDLKAVTAGTVDHNEFTVEKVHYQSMPWLYVTGNLYIPKNLEKPAPAILYVCGHSLVKKNDVSFGNKTAYQHHAGWFARNGYVCLVIDSLQLGEIEGIHHGTYRYKMWWWNSRGYTPAGVEAWNCIRALDYLQTRKEVDKERIGVTGRSGGGAYSWWISALDDRIKAAVPVAGITDLQNHVVDGTVEGHCDCMFIANTYRWDYPLVAALVAPRPLLISNTDKDNIFPLDGVVRLHEKVRNIYELYKAEKNLGLQITEGPHNDTQELRIHAFVWFNRFLKNENPPIDKLATPFFEPEQLKVFSELPADQVNTKIHESFVPLAPQPVVSQSTTEWAKQRDSWMNTLREKSFRGWPTETDAGSLDIKPVFSVKRHGIRFSAFDFTSQPYVRLRLYLTQPVSLKKPNTVTLNVLDDQQWTAWLSAMRSGFRSELDEPAFGGPEPNEIAFKQIQNVISNTNQVFAYFAPRGIGPTAWKVDEKKLTQIRRRFMLLGQTLDGMRVWDVRRAIQTLRSLDSVKGAPIGLKGREQMAGLILHASLFEPDVARLDLWNLPHSHNCLSAVSVADGPDFLNVLRYLDIPQALAMAAERSQVRLYQKDDFQWQFPRTVLERLGWPQEQFQVQAE